MRTAFYNGIVYTADEGKPSAEAFIVEGGCFLRVGTNEEIAAYGECEERIDLQGKCVIPGLVDSHCHILSGIESSAADMLFIEPETEPEELAGEIRKLLKERETSRGHGTVAVMGLDITRGTFHAGNLDGAFPDIPVLVFSGDGHAALINTKAMQMLGITRDTPDPDSGSYYARDGKGLPTGLVIEIPAMMPLKRLLPAPDENKRKEIMHEICRAYSACGYTTVFDAMSLDDGDDINLRVLKLLDAEGGLTLNVATSFGYRGEDFLPAREAVALMEEQRRAYTSAHVFPDTMKIISDGTVEEYSALLFDEYLDGEGGCGIEMLSPSEMELAAKLAAEKGFSVHIHAIGDKAVNRVLDVLCGLGSIKGTKTIAHNQLYREDDIERITRAKDIFFQTTPHWMTGDDYTCERLGKERYLKQFPVGTMQRNGVAVAFGSDTTIEDDAADAFLGMFHACARGDETLGDECLPPDTERLTREESLYAYTINGARQLGLDHVTGSITEGKSADFAVVDTDIISCPLDELKDVGVLETYFCGQLIYDGCPTTEGTAP